MTNGLTLTLSEQTVEGGPRQSIVMLEVENTSQQTVVLEPVRPRLPKGTELVGHISSREIVDQQRMEHLRSDLDELAKALALAHSPAIEAAEAEMAKRERNARRIGLLLSLMPLAAVIQPWALSGPKDPPVPAPRPHLPPPIESADDADDVRAFLLAIGVEVEDHRLRVFDGKARLLRRLEEHQVRARQVLAPGETMTAHYPLRLPLGGINPSHLTFAVEVESREVEVPPVGAVPSLAPFRPGPPTAAAPVVEVPGQPPTAVSTKECSVLVTPSPAKITAIAMLGALLGVVVRVIGEGRDLPGTTQDKWWPPLDVDQSELADLVFSADVGGALVTALILVVMTVANLDRLPWTRDLELGAGWRSAILVGIVVGLYGDRVLAALGAFVGTTGL